MEYSTKIMSFSNEIDQQKWKKNNAESANLFLFHNDLLSYLNSHLNVNRAEFDNKRFR